MKRKEALTAVPIWRKDVSIIPEISAKRRGQRTDYTPDISDAVNVVVYASTNSDCYVLFTV